MSNNKISVYTDGACKGNPGFGGWGAILQFNKRIKEIYGGEISSTNNRMELMAATMALSLLKYPCAINLYTDSRYLQYGISKWIDHWIINDWRTSKNSLIKNQDLWKQLNLLRRIHNISWFWIKSHSGHTMNSRADFLANKGTKKIDAIK